MCLGIPGRVVARDDADALPMADVDFGGVTKQVCLAYVPEARAGDYVLVHVGFALKLVDEESALETLELFRRLGTLAEELGGAAGRSTP